MNQTAKLKTKSALMVNTLLGIIKDPHHFKKNALMMQFK